MRRIDSHVHYFPQALVEALRERDRPPLLITSGGARIVDCGDGFAFPLLEALTDLRTQLERMDRDSIETAVLGSVPPGVDGLGEDAVPVARACNDELAEIARESGGRLAALAVLPVGTPGDCEEELERAATLGLSGGQLLSNVEGEPLDGPEREPIYEQAASLDLPLVLHPTKPRASEGLEDFGLLTTFGFIFDTATAAARLALSGVLERVPGLKLVLPHAGSLIPYQLARIDCELELLGPGDVKLGAPPSEQLRLLYLDSVCAWPPALRLALDVYGAERLLFGTDEPFWSGAEGSRALEALELEPAEEAAVGRDNARRLFRLVDRCQTPT